MPCDPGTYSASTPEHARVLWSTATGLLRAPVCTNPQVPSHGQVHGLLGMAVYPWVCIRVLTFLWVYVPAGTRFSAYRAEISCNPATTSSV